MEDKSEVGNMTLGPVRFSFNVNLGHVISFGMALAAMFLAWGDLKGDVRVLDTTQQTLSQRVDRDQASTDSQLVELRTKSAVMEVAIAEIKVNSKHTLDTVNRIEKKLEARGD